MLLESIILGHTPVPLDIASDITGLTKDELRTQEGYRSLEIEEPSFDELASECFDSAGNHNG